MCSILVVYFKSSIFGTRSQGLPNKEYRGVAAPSGQRLPGVLHRPGFRPAARVQVDFGVRGDGYVRTKCPHSSP